MLVKQFSAILGENVIFFLVHKHQYAEPVNICQILHGKTKKKLLYGVHVFTSVAYPGILFGGSTNAVQDRGQRERGSGGW